MKKNKKHIVLIVFILSIKLVFAQINFISLYQNDVKKKIPKEKHIEYYKFFDFETLTPKQKLQSKNDTFCFSIYTTKTEKVVSFLKKGKVFETYVIYKHVDFYLILRYFNQAYFDTDSKSVDLQMPKNIFFLNFNKKKIFFIDISDDFSNQSNIPNLIYEIDKNFVPKRCMNFKLETVIFYSDFKVNEYGELYERLFKITSPDNNSNDLVFKFITQDKFVSNNLILSENSTIFKINEKFRPLIFLLGGYYKIPNAITIINDFEW